MARIQGVDIPPNKRVEISLTYIYGIGNKTAHDVCVEAGIDPAIKVRDLSDDEVSRLSAIIETNCIVEGQLRRVVQQNIGRLKDIACYRGLRHRRGLPVRGQNTRNNSRTRKGPKRLVAKKK